MLMDEHPYYSKGRLINGDFRSYIVYGLCNPCLSLLEDESNIKTPTAIKTAQTGR
jgi:hypothetical protein